MSVGSQRWPVGIKHLFWKRFLWREWFLRPPTTGQDINLHFCNFLLVVLNEPLLDGTFIFHPASSFPSSCYAVRLRPSTCVLSVRHIFNWPPCMKLLNQSLIPSPSPLRYVDQTKTQTKQEGWRLSETSSCSGLVFISFIQWRRGSWRGCTGFRLSLDYHDIWMLFASF